MHRLNPASRRFYSAFYRWTQLGHDLRRHRRVLPQFPDTAPYSTSSPEDEGANDAAKSPSFTLRYTKSRPVAEDQPAADAAESAIWEKLPVLAFHQYRSDQMSLWEVVLRFRSRDETIVEYAVPSSVREALQKQYKPDLSDLSSQIGGLAVVRDGLSSGNKVFFLYSGASTGARRFDAIIGQFRPEAQADGRKAEGLQAKVGGSAMSSKKQYSAVATSWKAGLPLQAGPLGQDTRLQPWTYQRCLSEDMRNQDVQVAIPALWYSRHQEVITERMKAGKVRFDVKRPRRQSPRGRYLRLCFLKGTDNQIYHGYSVLVELKRESHGSYTTSEIRISPEVKDALTNRAAHLDRICNMREVDVDAYLDTSGDGSDAAILRFRCPPDQVSEARKVLDEAFPALATAEKSPPNALSPKDKLLTVLRPLVHPVVVVTSADPASNAEQATSTHSTDLQDCRGVTVSSFNTVSLNPAFVVSFNLSVPSRSWAAISRSERICAHIVESSSRGASLAHAFTQKNEDPAEPFRNIKAAGGQVLRLYGDSDRTPTIRLNDAVVGTIHAKILQDKCMHVGDHVVVMAEVLGSSVVAEHTLEVSQSLGLGYAQRGYRFVGEKWDPKLLNPTSATEKSDKHPPPPPPPQLPSKQSSNADAPVTINPIADGLDREDEGKSVSVAYNDGILVETGATEKEQAVQQEPLSTISRTNPYGVAHNPKGGDMPLGSSSSGQVPGSAFANHANPAPSKIPNPFQNTRREYSTDTTRRRPVHSLEALVSSPDLLKSTVAQFLSLSPDKFDRPPRMRLLEQARKKLYLASHKLEYLSANGMINTPEMNRLNAIISTNQALLSKNVGLRAAVDLRNMLDSGQLDLERARLLESSIEKSQAVILDEARELRQLANEGKLDDKQSAQMKAVLETQNDILKTEAMRLRAVAADEGNGE